MSTLNGLFEHLQSACRRPYTDAPAYQREHIFQSILQHSKQDEDVNGRMHMMHQFTQIQHCIELIRHCKQTALQRLLQQIESAPQCLQSRRAQIAMQCLLLPMYGNLAYMRQEYADAASFQEQALQALQDSQLPVEIKHIASLEQYLNLFRVRHAQGEASLALSLARVLLCAALGGNCGIAVLQSADAGLTPGADYLCRNVLQRLRPDAQHLQQVLSALAQDDGLNRTWRILFELLHALARGSGLEHIELAVLPDLRSLPPSLQALWLSLMLEGDLRNIDPACSAQLQAALYALPEQARTAMLPKAILQCAA